MSDETDWSRDLFPSSGHRRPNPRLSAEQEVEMANFGVIGNGSSVDPDYQGSGPGYIDPDYEAEQEYYPPVPGSSSHATKHSSYPSGMVLTREPSAGVMSSLTEDYSFMADLPSRREQASTAATIRRRHTVHRQQSSRRVHAAGSGSGERPDSPQYFDDEQDAEDVLPSMRSDRSNALSPRRSMRRRPPRAGAGQQVSAYRQVKWHIGLRWKLLKESTSNFFYHLGLWRDTMKQVEGRFGTGVVSYFLFLRWLVFLDLLLTLLIFSFVFIPQLTTSNTKTSELGVVNSTGREWYSYIQETISGEGYLEDTTLFIGVYTNATLEPGSYSMPYAYLMTVFSIFGVSLILLVLSMSKAYRESYSQDAGGQYSYSNKTFGAWEFAITDESTARLKCISIKKDFQEELQNEKALSEKWPFDKTVKAYSRRVVVNIIIFLMWVGAGVSIYFATEESIKANEEERSTDQSQLGYTETFSLFIRGLAASLTIAAFDIIFPTVFQQLSLFEMWRTPRTEVRATLLRTIAMRLSSLGVLMASVFVVIQQCPADENGQLTMGSVTNTTTMMPTTMMPTTMTPTTMTEAARRMPSTMNISNSTQSPCQHCWESFAGQELYQLTIIDFFIIVFVTIFGETIWRFSADRWGLVKDNIGPPEFFIAKSVLELLYAQALLWLGVFFSPLIPVICIIKFFIFFYCKKWSLLHNLKPSDRPYRAARNSNIFRGLLLFTLFLCLIPIGYAIVRIQPSVQCGPFRGKNHIYDVIPELLEMAPGWLDTLFTFLGSAGFLAPLFVLLLLVIYYYHALTKAQKENIKLLKDQLLLEGRDKQFLIGKVQRMQTALAGMSGTG